MNEEAAIEGNEPGTYAPDAGGVALAPFDFHIGGRSWRIQAARDHASLMAVADRFVAFPFGLLLWESAQALAHALAERKDDIVGRSVLELGAGVGLPGIVARWLGAASVRQTDHISETLELCQANARANDVVGIEVVLANWDAWTDTQAYDLIIGSDLVYERQAHAPLVAILERNLRPDGRVLLADPGRQDTPLFMADLAAKGWEASQHGYTVPSFMPGGEETVRVSVIELWR